MATGILCLAALFLVAWVIILKTENDGLRGDRQRLQEEVRRLAAACRLGVDVSGGRRLTASEIAHAERKAVVQRPGGR